MWEEKITLLKGGFSEFAISPPFKWWANVKTSKTSKTQNA
jgi:hypothetical protein